MVEALKKNYFLQVGQRHLSAGVILRMWSGVVDTLSHDHAHADACCPQEKLLVPPKMRERTVEKV